jgi:hypothetical protein
VEKEQKEERKGEQCRVEHRVVVYTEWVVERREDGDGDVRLKRSGTKKWGPANYTLLGGASKRQQVEQGLGPRKLFWLRADREKAGDDWLCCGFDAGWRARLGGRLGFWLVLAGVPEGLNPRQS